MVDGSRIQAVPVEVVSLDATGTLLHSPRLAETYGEVLARHGVKRPAEAVQDALRQTLVEFDARHIAGRNRFGPTLEDAQEYWRGFLDRVCQHLEAASPGPFAAAELFSRFDRAEAWEVFPEVPSVLARLSRSGTRLVVLSNWDLRLPELLERLDLSRHMEDVICSQEVGAEKPHGAIFLSAERRLGVSGDRIVHVGDSRRNDVEGAVGAGWRALWLDRDGDGDLASLVDLPAILEGTSG